MALHALHWGYICCYIHITCCITWPVTVYYMAHYRDMTRYIIMIGITGMINSSLAWIYLHELHGGYILCYIHITISITWPVTSLIAWSITLQITSLWLTLHELHWNYIFCYTHYICYYMACYKSITWIITYDFMSDYINFTSLSCNYMPSSAGFSSSSRRN